jgi:hypothetical protein
MPNNTQDWSRPGQTLRPGMLVMVVALDRTRGFHHGRIVSQERGSGSSATTFTIEVENENRASRYRGWIPKELL